MGDEKYVFFYKPEQINSVLKKNIVFRIILIFVFLLVGVLVYYRLQPEARILIYFIIAYDIYYIYLIMLSLVDLFNSKENLPKVTGTIIYTKGGIIHPIIVKSDNGSRIRLITDKTFFNTGDKVEIYYTRKSKIAVSCRLKR